MNQPSKLLNIYDASPIRIFLLKEDFVLIQLCTSVEMQLQGTFTFEGICSRENYQSILIIL